MSDLQSRIAGLSPEKRAVFERLLRSQSAAPAGETRQEYVAPATAAERILASAWEDVLRTPRVGLRDNFFALGGDSIQSIQVVARVREAGFELNNQLLFETPILGELASRLVPRPERCVSQEALAGPGPLTPIQQWFFTLDLPNPAHWNQAVLLELPASMQPEHVRAAADALVTHHDVLRCRFTRRGDGWHQECAPADCAAFELRDFSGVDAGARRRAVEEAAAQAQGRFDLARGPLVRFVFFQRGQGMTPRLLLIAHHLVVDGISFRVLIEDLQRALDRRASGHEIVLPLKTASFFDWAEHQASRAKTIDEAIEIDFWERHLAGRSCRLRVDHELGPNLESSVDEIEETLNEADTRSLMRSTSAAGASLMHALFAGLWSASQESVEGDAFLVDLEGHGRDEVPGAPDVSRTVGWFTSLYPVCLAGQPDTAWPRAIAAVRAALAEVTPRASAFGLLRYQGTPLAAQRLAALPRPSVMLNYLGQFGQIEAGTEFRLASESAGPLFDPAGVRPHLWQFVAGVFGGRLRVRCLFSRNLHKQETVASVMRHLRATLETAAADPTRASLPGAVIDNRVSADDLARLASLHAK